MKSWCYISLLMFTLYFSSDLFASELPSIKLDTRYMPASDIKSQAGQFTAAEVHIRIGQKFKLGNLPIDASIGGNHFVIIDDETNLLPASLKSRGLHLFTEFPLPANDDERFFLGWGVNPTYQTAKGSNFAQDGFRIRTSAYLGFKESEDLTIKGGVTFRPEYDMDYFPFIGLNYSPGEHWSYEVMSDEASVTSTISYAFSEKNSILVEGIYESDEFEFSSGENEGRNLRYQDVTVGLGWKHQFNKHFKATVKGGGVMSRKIEFLDGVGKVAPENSPYVGVDVAYQF